MDCANGSILAPPTDCTNGSIFAPPTDCTNSSIQAIWCSGFWCSSVFMGKTKDDIWSKFGQSYKQGDAKLSYYKCSACDEPMIAAVGYMHDHWVKCKKHPYAIGQLDAGF